MKIANLWIRKIDNYNIVVHKDLGILEKTGSPRMDEPVTYHGSIESALISARKRLQREGINAKAEVDEVLAHFKKIDKEFLEALKTFNEELAELMEKKLC